ncbi:MAG TPA: 16S rRNA (adenine(1518)-N(6)/adenine(1519)-N(6))-dimethyltransferase RsmA [Actinomycetota bacterium]|nr:16S rRNA (adenine(1518)-N(6)/adenine(1519)-N(6))-dimethyltransferase RsmA [Actinomycetota bacterium]
MTTAELLGARRLRELMARYGAAPKRSLGQNFVIDPNTIRKVLDVAALSPADRVLEVGAGCGSLTLGLASRAAEVVALEIDDRLVALLGESLAGVQNVRVVQADALEFPYADADATSVVGNLPYNIAAHLVLKILEDAPAISKLTVMTQREVGERLAAAAGSKAYGQTSVMVRYFGRAQVAAQISRRAFFPVPNVDSVVVRIEREDAPDVDRDVLFSIVKAAFSQRRKNLRNTIGSVAGSPERAEEALSRAGIDPRARGEELDLDAFVALAREIT